MKKITTLVLGIVLIGFWITRVPEPPTQEEIDSHCEKVLLDNHTFVCR